MQPVVHVPAQKKQGRDVMHARVVLAHWLHLKLPAGHC
jgi:hypothetical protein